MGIIKDVLGTVGQVINGPQPLDAQNQNGRFQNSPSQNDQYYNGGCRERRQMRKAERVARRADQFSGQNGYGRFPGPAPMMQQPMNDGPYRRSYDERMTGYPMMQQPVNDAYARGYDERPAGYGMMQPPMNAAPYRRSYDERLAAYPMMQQPVNDASYRRSFDGRSGVYPPGAQGTAFIADLPAELPARNHQRDVYNTRPAAGQESQESQLLDAPPPSYEQAMRKPRKA